MEERVFNLQSLKRFANKEVKINLYETDKSSAALWCLQPGQEVFLHNHPNADDVWVVLEGEGQYFLKTDETTPIHMGMAILAASGQVHGMRNTGTENFTFIAVSAPVPVEVTHL